MNFWYYKVKQVNISKGGKLSSNLNSRSNAPAPLWSFIFSVSTWVWVCARLHDWSQAKSGFELSPRKLYYFQKLANNDWLSLSHTHTKSHLCIVTETFKTLSQRTDLRKTDGGTWTRPRIWGITGLSNHRSRISTHLPGTHRAEAAGR